MVCGAKCKKPLPSGVVHTLTVLKRKLLSFPMSSPSKRMPNFFVVGAPKAGTTSLYHYLDQHPEVYMSPIKEPNYFSSEVRPENLSEELQERSRNDLQAVKEYLRGPMSEKRFGGMVLEWEDYLRLFQ